MFNGYIRLWRKMLDTSFWRNSNAVHLAIHFLLQANHKPYKMLFDGVEIVVERGQLITGLHKIETETGLTTQKTRTALKILRNCHFLTSKSTNKLTSITVCNYNDYQQEPTSKLTSNLTNEQQTNNKPITTIQEVKELKEVKEYNNISSFENKQQMPVITKKPKREGKYLTEALFEQIWSIYPRKIGKAKAFDKALLQILNETDFKNAENAIKNYTKSVIGLKMDFVKHGSTFFNEVWRDYVDFKDTGFVQEVVKPKKVEDVEKPETEAQREENLKNFKKIIGSIK